MLLKRITTASLFFIISPYLKRVLNVIHFHVMKNFTKGAFNGVLYWFGLSPPPLHPLAFEAVRGSAALAANSTSCQMWNK